MTALPEADRNHLRDMIERDWVEATLAGDWDRSVSLCSEDLVYMPPDSPVLNGRAETKGFFEDFPPITQFSQTLEWVDGGVDRAVVRGTFALSMSVEGEEVAGNGKFLCTATKQSGAWLFDAVCFNWDAPPA
jgi:ketosteroid isomerase-like protein